MTRGGRGPPKQLKRKVGTNPTRVQPARRCKVTSQAPMPVMSTEHTASGRLVDPRENSHSQVTRRRRASQRQAASKLSSRKAPPAASLAPSVTKPTKSVASIPGKLDQNLSRVELRDIDESLKPVSLAPQTRRATKRGQEEAPKGSNTSISGKRLPKPPIRTENSSPPFLTTSVRKLRSSRISGPQRSMFHQNTSQSVKDKPTKPQSLRGTRKTLMHEGLINETVNNQSVTLSDSAAKSALPVFHFDVSITDTLESGSGPSTQQDFRTARSTSEVALPIPNAHKLVHIVRHCRAWHNLRPRGKEFLYQIHDPGLTPGGTEEAKLFTQLYPFLRRPQIIITSHLRRALQMSLHISSSLSNDYPASQSIRIVAHPDLQEVSTEPCDTGTPLDILREEFPTIDFPDALFPEEYPRDRTLEPDKWGSIYDDDPELLAARAGRIREFIKGGLEETEIILVTHGSFIHYLFNRWTGEPGSHSASAQLQPGEAQPMTMPGKSFPEQDFQPLIQYAGPLYPLKWKLQDYEPRILYFETRDCGIFTNETIRNAVGRGD